MFKKATTKCPQCQMKLQAWYEDEVSEITCPWCHYSMAVCDISDSDEAMADMHVPFVHRVIARFRRPDGLSCNNNLL